MYMLMSQSKEKTPYLKGIFDFFHKEKATDSSVTILDRMNHFLAVVILVAKVPRVAVTEMEAV